MAYFVTGATGFIGRFLVDKLIQREGTIYVLVRKGSVKKLDHLRGPDLRDRERLEVLEGFGPGVAFAAVHVVSLDEWFSDRPQDRPYF